MERVEKQVVSKSESKQLAANGAATADDDHGWDTAWSDGEQEAENKAVGAGGSNQPPGQADDADDAVDAWGWGGDEEETAPEKPDAPQAKTQDDDQDPLDAWGWGDDAANDDETSADDPGPKDPRSTVTSGPQTREITFKEIYHISSMPQPVLDLIFTIVEDGASLTHDSYASSPVAAAAAGLFSLPTLVLAMFRAVSPHYYAPDLGGNMWVYF